MKFTGRLSGIHMQCAGLTLALHLAAAGVSVVTLKTIHSTLYAFTALVLLLEYVKAAW